MICIPYKDKQKNREYQREWARRKKLGLPTSKKRVKLTENEIKKRNNECRREWRKNLRKKRDEVFGIECFFCGISRKDNKRMFLHKKDGKRHRSSTKELRKAIKEKEKWVLLCGKCHEGVHFCMNIFGMRWNDIIKVKGGVSVIWHHPCLG